MLHIVRALLPGPLGFNEVGREAGGCNPSTLAQRLARLEQAGLVQKREDADGCRSLYALTPSGEGLDVVVRAIEAWASRHLEAPSPGTAPSRRVPRGRADAFGVGASPLRARDAEEFRERVGTLSAVPISEGA